MIGLRELVVHNMRGVRDLRITISEKSIVLVGPNGSGKSSVVDALDFLLTGRVHRLEGQGAGGLSVADHGKHVDAELDDAWVEATFMVGGPQKKPVTIRRSVKPAKLEPEILPAPLSELFDQAQRFGHHLLSRREILKFILATPGARREQVAALLDIAEIDPQRKELSGAKKEADAAAKQALNDAEAAERELMSVFDPAARTLSDVLVRINAHRISLGAPTIAELSSGLVLSSVPDRDAALDVPHPLRAAELSLRSVTVVDSGSSTLGKSVEGYLEAVVQARTTEARLAERQRQLLEAGLELLAEDRCPLCETVLATDTLRERWRGRLAEVEKAAHEMARLRVERARLTVLLSEMTRETRTISHELRDCPEAAPISDVCVGLANIGQLPDVLEDSESFDLEMLNGLLARLVSCVTTLLEIAEALPPRSAGAKAWSELEAAQRKLFALEAARASVPRAREASNFLGLVDKAFVAACDGVLDGVYDEMAGRVQELYGGIHKSGGQPAKTSLKSTKTGLEFEVEFYGRGGYPPVAFHSEGQQDTLGICLFLALAERAAGGTPRLLLLDDVLMSVDADHRRAVAELLKAEFSESQLVITTHDEVWAKQLSSLGIVAKRFSFNTWSIEGANEALIGETPFDQMRVDLQASRVPTAAHLLRRTLEATLPDICDALGASVRFRQDGKYGLGDYYFGAKSRYAELLKESIKATKSWKQETVHLEGLLAQYEKAREVVVREEWTLNPIVHYNEWAQMTAADFAPVVDSYQAFLAFFTCGDCKSLLRADDAAVRCGCGKQSWNLTKKRATHR